MKRLVYARSSSDVKLHITDLFTTISKIVYVDDINTDAAISINSSVDIDYSSFPDSRLARLSESRIHSIRDLHTLHRIYNLVPDKLSDEQLDELASVYHILILYPFIN